jgi:transcriptional regulator with XRE-family HTH domain
MRARNRNVDDMIGATIRIRRLKLGMNQTELGRAIGVAFQQIQKYENGTNSVAAARIPDLCRVLEISPNGLFGMSRRPDVEIVRLSSWATKTALKLEEASPALRRAIDAMLTASPQQC